jgi:hypothetical protein
VATEVEKIVYSRVHIKESLRLSPRFETAHTPLSNASRLMWKLSSIVRIMGRVVYRLGYQLAMSHTVASQLVRHDLAWLIPVTFEQSPEEALGGLPISARLQEYINDLPSWSTARHRYCCLPLDIHEHLVEEKRIVVASVGAP